MSYTEPTLDEIREFVATLMFRKFASYVVSKLMQRYGFTREYATEIWYKLQEVN